MGVAASVLGVFTLFAAYVYTNDQKLLAVPSKALKAYTPWTEEDVQQLNDKTSAELAVDLKRCLGEKTGRRYVIVGGVRFPCKAILRATNKKS